MVKLFTNKKRYFDIVLFFLVVIYPELYRYILVAANRIGGLINLEINRVVVDSFVWFSAIIVFYEEFLRRIRVLDWCIFFSFVFIFTIFYLGESNIKYTFERYVTLIFTTVPYYFCGAIYRFNKSQLKIIYPLTAITFIIAYIYIYFFTALKGLLQEDNMYFSYQLLPLVLVLISAIFEPGYKKYSILGAFGVIFMIMLGTRGSIFCIAVFIVIMIFKKLTFKKIFSIGMIVVFLSVFSGSYIFSNVVKTLTLGTERMGMSTRILDMSKDNDMLNDSGRNYISELVIENIKENPLAMPGPYSDRVVTSTRIDPEDVDAGTYSHNIFLEIWSNYGILLGTIFNVLILFLIIRLLMRITEKTSMIASVFVCTGFVMLIFSSSYLNCNSFFLLIGIALNPYFIRKTDYGLEV